MDAVLGPAKPSSWIWPVELYFEIVYPIFLVFHQLSFTRRISRAAFMNEKPLFAVTMVICSLVSSRVRDGAVCNPERDLSPHDFYMQAKAQLGRLEADTDIDILRAHAILAISSIQNGEIKDMHLHLGTYHNLIAMDALHDRSNWPKGIGNVEREERRRLFWSICTLEVHVSVVWGGIMRDREKQSKVAYPKEIGDDCISDSIAQMATVRQDMSPSSRRHTSRVSGDCWLSGRNFITDLYRVLEHALARFRKHSNHNTECSFLQDIFNDHQPGVIESPVGDSVLQMYINLPDCFKETPDVTFESKKGIFCLQADNITGSLQLVRTVLFAARG